jgi:hypothetical protein
VSARALDGMATPVVSVSDIGKDEDEEGEREIEVIVLVVVAKVALPIISVLVILIIIYISSIIFIVKKLIKNMNSYKISNNILLYYVKSITI